MLESDASHFPVPGAPDPTKKKKPYKLLDPALLGQANDLIAAEAAAIAEVQPLPSADEMRTAWGEAQAELIYVPSKQRCAPSPHLLRSPCTGTLTAPHGPFTALHSPLTCPSHALPSQPLTCAHSPSQPLTAHAPRPPSRPLTPPSLPLTPPHAPSRHPAQVRGLVHRGQGRAAAGLPAAAAARQELRDARQQEGAEGREEA